MVISPLTPHGLEENGPQPMPSPLFPKRGTERRFGELVLWLQKFDRVFVLGARRDVESGFALSRRVTSGPFASKCGIAST
jgi:hypothetical protein